MSDAALLDELAGFLAATGQPPLTPQQLARLTPALAVLKQKSRTLPQLLEQGRFALIERPVQQDDKAAAALDTVSKGILGDLTAAMQNVIWARDDLEAIAQRIAESNGLGLGKIAAPVRAALAGRTSTPSIFDMMLALGRDETLARLADATA